MNPAWRYAAVALAAGIGALLWPLTPALSSRDAVQARLAAAVVAAIACAMLPLVKGRRFKVWIGVSVLSAAAAVALLLAHFNAATACVANYEGRPVIIGRDYAPDIETYIKDNPGLSAADRLFDAGGVADRVWTTDSIRSCRLLVSWAGLAAIPLFAACVAALISSGRRSFLPVPPAPAAGGISAPARTPVYDAFLSYRHLEPDTTHAVEMLESLEGRGLRLAIDFRDFSPNEHFLSEMERCIKDSRFVLCVVTSHYLQSDHTSEEAIISKTLDLAERRRRLVPLIFERVELPVWLHGLVGIDFTAAARVDPLDRLAGLLTTKPPPAPT
jgi:hypothetical protein